MTAKIEKLKDQLAEREARLEVIEDILSLETHPDHLRNYRSQRARARNRIADLKRMIARAEAAS